MRRRHEEDDLRLTDWLTGGRAGGDRSDGFVGVPRPASGGGLTQATPLLSSLARSPIRSFRFSSVRNFPSLEALLCRNHSSRSISRAIPSFPRDHSTTGVEVMCSSGDQCRSLGRVLPPSSGNSGSQLWRKESDGRRGTEFTRG